MKRRIVFLDELPWLAGPQSSELITELGYFWNSWADRQRNIVLVVCGSATSWMLDNVILEENGISYWVGRKICFDGEKLAVFLTSNPDALKGKKLSKKR